MIRAWLADRWHRVDAAVDATGDPWALSILRVLLGPITLMHLEPFLRLAADGVVYSDRFYDPFFAWYPEAGGELYVAMLWTACVFAVLMSIGLFTRLSCAYVTWFVAYNLFLSTTHFSHNRAFLIILLAGVTIVPTGRHWSVDAWVARRRRRTPATSTPLWPLWLLRFEVCAVYLASATSKLIDPDWWGGRVLQLRAVQSRDLAIDAGAPVWILDLATDSSFQWFFSKAAVLTEFTIVATLLWPRARRFGVALAVMFHLAIEVSFNVQIFTWAAIAALLIWHTPPIDPRRDPTTNAEQDPTDDRRATSERPETGMATVPPLATAEPVWSGSGAASLSSVGVAHARRAGAAERWQRAWWRPRR